MFAGEYLCKVDEKGRFIVPSPIREQVESEAPPLLVPGTYLEPFALRALASVRQDAELLDRAVASFAAMGLAWYAAETGTLLAS